MICRCPWCILVLVAHGDVYVGTSQVKNAILMHARRGRHAMHDLPALALSVYHDERRFGYSVLRRLMQLRCVQWSTLEHLRIEVLLSPTASGQFFL